MCGIVVHVALKGGGTTESEEEVKKCLQLLHHRGPDGSKILAPETSFGPSVVLGHTRLAVVGNDNATQPLTRKVGNISFYLVHNGEIYNYKDLRMQLISDDGNCTEAVSLTTDGDSEILLACLAHRGITWTLNNIHGMFAFVFVECRATYEGEHVTKIVMCRDAFGIKPLCFAFDDDEKQDHLFISSTIQAMPHNTGLTNIQDVQPSSYIEVNIQTAEAAGPSWTTCEHKYNTLGAAAIPNNEKRLLHNQKLSEIRSRLIDAISIRIPDAVPFAVLLSGGLDSSLICRIVADQIYPRLLHTFTITAPVEIDGHSMVEADSHFARLVADGAPNIIHTEVPFTFEDGLIVLPDAVRCMETADPAIIRAGIPLYLLSKHISSQGFKVVLSGEGADESMAGYRLFERFFDIDQFTQELNRRLFNIDTSELQRVDRCTSAHGLEARVPFMDVSYVKAVMGIGANEVSLFVLWDYVAYRTIHIHSPYSALNSYQKMTHPALGRIQKYFLRKAFDGEYYQSNITNEQLLPDSVLYREKEQFADGIGQSWMHQLQNHATKLFPNQSSIEEAERALYNHYLTKHPENHPGLPHLIQSRKERRKQGALSGMPRRPGQSQPTRCYPIRNDPDLQQLNLTKEDAVTFLTCVLGWTFDEANSFTPSLDNLNKIIVSMLSRVPFHNLTLLTRERRPPTIAEIKSDMMSGIGGPCAVVNAFFAVLLDVLGFGPYVYLVR